MDNQYIANALHTSDVESAVCGQQVLTYINSMIVQARKLSARLEAAPKKIQPITEYSQSVRQ